MTEQKPHPTAFKRDTPCARCGSRWFRPGLRIIPDATEMPTVTLCAQCKQPLPVEGAPDA